MRETGRSGCPIKLALEVLGDRWSLLILRDVIFAGNRTFNQRLGSDEGIATNVLRDRLNSLVERGLLTKSDDPERKGCTRYALTERAITLVPVLVHLGHWGEGWLSADPDLRRMNRRRFTGGPGLWEKIMDELRA
jgi:DNA-binding HxlR family transcriptional regulator